MIPIIEQKKTGINLRLMMDERGITDKRCSAISGTGQRTKCISLVEWSQHANRGQSVCSQLFVPCSSR